MKKITLRFVMGIISLLLAALILYKFSFLTITVVIGFLIYSLVAKCVEILERNRIKAWQAYSLMTVVSCILIVMFFLYISIPLYTQIQSFSQQLPSILLRLQENIGKLQNVSPLLSPLIVKTRGVLASGFTQFLELSGSLVTAVVTIPLLVVILLASRKTLSKTVIESIPNNYFEVTVTIIQRIISHIEDYAWAKTLEMIIMVVVYAIGFQIIGLPQALFISIIGGVLNIIPYFGPLLTIIPVAVAAYTGGGTEIFILGIIVLVLARIIDDAVLQTILVAKLVDVHPLIVLLVTLVGEQMLGIVGMIIAVPAYVVTKIVIEGMYEYLMALQRHELLHSEKNNEQNNT